jgi:hypothetical protein
MATFGTRVTTTTQDKLIPKVVDTILNSNVLAVRTMGRAKPWTGENVKYPIKYQKNSTGTSFSGYDLLSTAASTTRVNLQFDPRFYSITASLPLDEVDVNDTAEKVLDLVGIELESTAQDMADDIGTLFYGDGTGNSNKDFLGLGAHVDDGNSVATYGELARATYTTIKAIVTASGGTLTLAKMATLYNAISSGSVKPTIGLTTETVFSLYEQLLQPQERIMKDIGLIPGGLKGGTGFTGLDYKGVAIISDEKCTSGVLFFLNENFLDWKALPSKEYAPVNFSMKDIQGNDYSSVKGLGFSWSGWIKPVNQYAIVGHIHIGGNFVCSNPKRQGKLTGITAV